MNHRPNLLFLCFLFSVFSHSQQPEQVLSQWTEKVPIEKVYLHFDRSGYFPGQTMWFKAYLYAGIYPSTMSTSLYVELLNKSSKVIRRNVFPIFGGFSRGQIELPDSLTGDAYAIRAYTAEMLNHDQELLYIKMIPVFGKNQSRSEVSKEPRVEFFPEGGNLIAGLSNSMAFKITNKNGLPLMASGKLKDESGREVASLVPSHDGMGYVDFTPDENMKYYVVLDEDEKKVKHYLPAQHKKGIVLRVLNLGKEKQFEILQHTADPNFTAAYMIGQMQHQVVFRTDFKNVKNELTGTIKTGDLSSGILQVTVFNKDGVPLAERLTFIDNKEYLIKGTISTDTINFDKRGFNRLSLVLKDTIVGSFSVSVTDENFEIDSTRPENIFSGILLTSDLKGYIHRPSYYFSSDNQTVSEALDLVMMTNGWRRFKWSELNKQVNSGKKFSDAGFISINGKVMLEGTKKPFAEKQMMAIIMTADSGRKMQMVTTDKEGVFKLDSLVYFTRAKIYLSDIKGRKSKFIEVRINGDSITRQFNLPPLTWQPVNTGKAESYADAKRFHDEYDEIMRAEGEMLGEVVVLGVKKTKLQQFEEKHVSGLFAGDALRTMDFLSDDLGPYANVLDYLRFRVPGLSIVEPNYENDPTAAGYQIYFRQGPTISDMGVIPMTVFLDEVEVDPNVIASIPGSQVAMVKLFSNFVGAAGGGAGGALAVYTKRGEDFLNATQSSGDMLVAPGYSVVKEFYSPDYSVKRQDAEADNRITLLWNSGIIVAGINPILPIRFYNNDRTKKFRIVVEGMTAEGKFLMIEKIVQ